MSSLRTSFGLASLALALLTVPLSAQVDVVPFGSEWLHYTPATIDDFPGRSFETNWFKTDFDTTTNPAWSGPSPGPLAYGRVSVFDPVSRQFVRPLATELTQPASGDRLTSYFRYNFTTTEELTNFGIDAVIMDGGKIFLDGRQILNVNCCSIDGAMLFSDDPDEFLATSIVRGQERLYSRFLTDLDSLPAGDHVLAVAVHNDSARSSDLGFSMRMFSGLERLVDSGSDWRYFEGTQEPSGGTTAWIQSGFNDSGWAEGADGFGYDADASSPLYDLINTPLDDMQNLYGSLYARKQFTVSDPSAVGELTLFVDWDDAFFAYVNGELAFSSQRHPNRDDATAPIPFDWDGAASHESTNGEGLPSDFTISLADFPGLLTAGDNTIAIQAFNSSLDSSDFFLGQISLVGIAGEGPVGLPGDFDGSGTLDQPDIDDLTGQSASGQDNVAYDLNADGLVNTTDVNVWINDLFGSWVGDANVDGEFSSGDLVAVLSSGTFGTGIASVWSTGDFNGDGFTTSGDLVAALSDGGFGQGVRGAVSAVPEPSTLLLLSLAMLFVCPRSRYHSDRNARNNSLLCHGEQNLDND